MPGAESQQIEPGVDPVEVPRRVAFLPERVPARFLEEKAPEDLVMAFPHLIIRTVICFLIVVAGMSLLAIFVDAPLEELADPQHTPNPAKAPWYFLGLQELLHYFPPVVAGVLLPGLVIIALVVIPYFRVNVRREGMWDRNPRVRFLILTTAVTAIAVVTGLFHAFDIVIPTVLLYAVTVIPFFLPKREGWIGWLRARSLAEWIMTLFVLLATVLTLIGTYFRGPGWSWVWPWQGGGL